MLITQIGLCNFLFGWPIIIFLRLTDIESSNLGDLSTYQLFSNEITKQVITYISVATLFGSGLATPFYLTIFKYISI